MNKHETETEVKVTVVLTGSHAKRFTQAVLKSGRSNRSEARIRIQDHLEQYEEIASLGSRVKRKF